MALVKMDAVAGCAGHVDCYQLHQGKRVVDDEEGHHQNKEDGQNVNPT